MRILVVIFIAIFLAGCQQNKKQSDFDRPEWNTRKAVEKHYSNLYGGKTYLPVYSHIYHIKEKQNYNLAVTVSIRNISLSDSVYILLGDYYNTEGTKIQNYIPYPVYLSPMETIEIVIPDSDNPGGSGANFIFDWAVKDSINPPLFEAVMISTYGQQGLSFTSRGVRLYE